MLPPKWSSFENPNDARCAWLVWFLLLAVFCGYVALATLSLRTELQTADQTEFYDAVLPLPAYSMDVCQMAALSKRLNYSVIDHIQMRFRFEYWVNGSEVIVKKQISSPEAKAYQISEEFQCRRFSAGTRLPQAAESPYMGIDLRVEGEVPAQMLSYNGTFVDGVFLRPSLAEDPTNKHAVQEERISTFLIPVVNSTGKRRIIVTQRYAFASWSDSLGGRRGAPCNDTFFFSGTTMLPESYNVAIETTTNDTAERWPLKLAMPGTHSVQVYRFVNDIWETLLDWFGRVAAATAIFRILAVLFPLVQEEKYKLLFQLPALGLGVAETAPLLPKSETSSQTV
ncbi:unnamed protein product [Effrenium voratum]|uniref:Transmembrane protein 231 n=1 Tax=Effrenium voratum TaxID=2562239 RepID=A0AA36MXA0_9DINO|nr:unnamed protein product [Effrenium voratum]CAJ1420230.1 unnamed protein product [Effrenium voratum]